MSDETHQSAEAPAPGTFCWTEIAVKDAAKCKAFYSEVFGWNWQDNNEVTEGFVYHEFSTGEPFPAGGLYEITPEMFGDDAPPPHFLSYVAVNSVDETAALAEEIGGVIIKEPADIPNTGRFAIVQDPSGAMLAVFTMGGGANG
ncbi:MAG: VOC family protein [Acidobacteria bacterium]|nr:VOC family protein [Acidobacteriota bacterium]MCW5949054.1 VOC family protein [Pyrinomonadaceae bacterium]